MAGLMKSGGAEGGENAGRAWVSGPGRRSVWPAPEALCRAPPSTYRPGRVPPYAAFTERRFFLPPRQKTFAHRARVVCRTHAPRIANDMRSEMPWRAFAFFHFGGVALRDPATIARCRKVFCPTSPDGARNMLTLRLLGAVSMRFRAVAFSPRLRKEFDGRRSHRTDTGANPLSSLVLVIIIVPIRQ